MFKIVSQDEKENEELLKKELNIENTLEDFFYDSEEDSIINKIKETIIDTKNKTKTKGDAFYTKFIYYISLLVNEEDFEYDDKGIECIDKIIKICESEKIKEIYSDLYGLFDESDKEFKGYILKKINDSSINLPEDSVKNIIELFVDYIKNNDEKDIEDDIFVSLSMFVIKYNAFIYLNKISEIENVRKVISRKSRNRMIKENKDVSKLYFYLNATSKNFVDFSLENEMGLNTELIYERKLANCLQHREDSTLLFDNEEFLNDFAKTYGKKCAEKIISMSKEVTMHEIFSEYCDENQKIVTFSELIKKIYEENEDKEFENDEIENDFEIIEESIIEGNNDKLFKIFIDYEKKEIKIMYLKKQFYEDSDKETLLEKVKNMKKNLENILNSLDKIN